MLPTGLTYSSLAKRFIPFIANCTCGVGRRVFRSSSKRVARRDAGMRRATLTPAKLRCGRARDHRVLCRIWRCPADLGASGPGSGDSSAESARARGRIGVRSLDLNGESSDRRHLCRDRAVAYPPAPPGEGGSPPFRRSPKQGWSKFQATNRVSGDWEDASEPDWISHSAERSALCLL